MTSILNARHSALFRANPQMDLQDPMLQHSPKTDASDKNRGRRVARATTNDTAPPPAAPVENDEDGESSGTDEGPSRKRRRSRKGLGKKFECPHDGCGKSYSRAEHLYRHQLNHTPKQIYNCDFEGCNRTFVRQDLCSRHRDRHTAKGSQLHRKDSMLSNSSPMIQVIKPPVVQDRPRPLPGPASPKIKRPSLGGSVKTRTNQLQSPSPQLPTATYSPVTTASSGTYSGSVSGVENIPQSGNFRIPPDGDRTMSGVVRTHQRQSFGAMDSKPPDFNRTTIQASVGPYGLISPTSQNYTAARIGQPHPYVSQHNFAPFSLPPSEFAATTIATTIAPSRESDPPYSESRMDFNMSQQQQSGAEMMLLDQMSAPSTMPVFGGEGGYNRSPFAMPEDFIAYLLMDGQTAGSQMGQQNYQAFHDGQAYTPYYPTDVNMGYYPPTTQSLPHPMAVTSLLDTSLPETVISEEKSQAIVDVIRERFNGSERTLAAQKETLLEGDRSDETHLLSRRMMQTYIGSYWYHFSDQLPILHKPTFAPDKTPTLLLMAMIVIGASNLDKMHGPRLTEACFKLSNFLAWHLRFAIFEDDAFRPPAQLWVFQALLLLEMYEKMYSTRALHESSHIHHYTTITLMRRGSSLIGRSALDSPPNARDDKGTHSSRQSSASGANTPDEWWNHWIVSESTKRAAFAAFVIDSTHATMFGHTAAMVAHEMRLPLPCDETLWTATSSAETGRIEASLNAHGVKPVSFLEGLKRTLAGQDVRTNSFGRTILMAGLLSVSWHMNQRDIQVNSLGVSQALGGRDKWRSSLIKAFDHWRDDFDRSLKRQHDSAIPGPYLSDKPSEHVGFKARTVLHHLAHMAMHVEIIDCQTYARAKRLLGRHMSPQDLSSATRKMKDLWAPTARARDATWYALRFLCSVLLPEDAYGGGAAPFTYSARDDMLLNRPWVMYVAALIIWSYGFALEGPSRAAAPPAGDVDAQVRDMRVFLRRLASAQSPEALKDMRGFNGCAGLLMVLRGVFEKTRWELLHEAALLLGNCVQLLGGGG